MEDRVSSETKKLGVSFDAPKWLQIDYVRVHTPPSRPNKHRSLPSSCRPGPTPVEIISHLPAYHITRGTLAAEGSIPTSPIHVKKQLTWQKELTLDPTTIGTPPSTPRTPLSAGGTPPLSPRTPHSPRSPRSPRRYDEQEVHRQPKINSPTSPLPNHMRSRAFFPDQQNPSLIASADENILHKMGYKRNQLRLTNHILGPLLRDTTHTFVYRSLHGEDHVPQELRYAHRCDRRHVKEENYGKRRLVPPHMLKFGSTAQLTKHIGSTAQSTANSLKACGFCSLSPVQKRGNRKQFAGSSSGGRSQLRLY